MSLVQRSVRLVATLARVRTISWVSMAQAHVLVQVSCMRKFILTQRTLIRALFSVGATMSLQLRWVIAFVVTNQARILASTLPSLKMLFYVPIAIAFVVTSRANKRILSLGVMKTVCLAVITIRPAIILREVRST